MVLLTHSSSQPSEVVLQVYMSAINVYGGALLRSVLGLNGRVYAAPPMNMEAWMLYV